MDIKQFISFKTIVELGSFTQASEKLHYAQSTISSHIQAIEEYMGSPVFHRIGKSISLTEVGEKLYPKAVKLLELYSDIESIPSEGEILKGKIKIGMPESVMLYKASPVLQEFKRKYPNVDLFVETDYCSKLRERVYKGELDFAFLIDSKLEHPNLIFEHLSYEDLVVIISKENDKIDNTKEQTVLYTESGCSYRNIFEDYLAKESVISQNIIETASVELIKKYVLCGIGISLLPYYAVKDDIENKKIRGLKVEGYEKCYTQLVYHANRWRSKIMEAFIDICREKIKNTDEVFCERCQ